MQRKSSRSDNPTSLPPPSDSLSPPPSLSSLSTRGIFFCFPPPSFLSSSWAVFYILSDLAPGACGRVESDRKGNQVPLVLAGYRRSGDGLGSHVDNIREHLEQARDVLVDEIVNNQSSLVKVFRLVPLLASSVSQIGTFPSITLVVVEPYQYGVEVGIKL
eukprot:745787-Hanusia_phi.AAC.2